MIRYEVTLTVRRTPTGTWFPYTVHIFGAGMPRDVAIARAGVLAAQDGWEIIGDVAVKDGA